MFENIEQVYTYLFSKKASLRSDKTKFKQLMADLNHPYRQLTCIHIGGTNGKGSTTNYLRSILQAGGYRVGTFTSPHLVKYNDRMRVNDQWISDEFLIKIVNQQHQLWEAYDLSMFEINMFISIYYFLAEQVDFALYEVGIGGLRDTTNIIDARLCLITNIGFDHMELLGYTYPEIAYQKVGIVKSGRTLITTETNPECLTVFQQAVAKAQGELLVVWPEAVTLLNNQVSFSWAKQNYLLNTLALYQAKNATLAVRAALWLNQAGLINIQLETIKSAILTASWAGRFEIVSKDPLIILDGAHNPPAMEKLIEEMKHLPTPRIVVFSALKDKDYVTMLKLLQSVATEIIVTQFEYPRAALAHELAQDQSVLINEDYHQAIFTAKTKLIQLGQGSLLITGSLYFISEVRNNYFKE